MVKLAKNSGFHRKYILNLQQPIPIRVWGRLGPFRVSQILPCLIFNLLINDYQSYYDILFSHFQNQMMSLEEIIRGVQSSDSAVQLQSTQSCRRILSRERQPPIDNVIEAGVVPRLVQFLANADK